MTRRAGWVRSFVAVAVGGLSLVLTSCEAGTAASSTTLHAAGTTGVFHCPGSQDVGALAAAALSTTTSGPRGCDYRTGTGAVEPARVMIEHPPTAVDAGSTLPELRSALVKAGQVDIVAAPQFSSDAFVASSADHSCAVWVRAVDGGPMSVSVSRAQTDTLANCALARSITALVGTDPRPAPTAPTVSVPGSSGTASPGGQPSDHSSVSPSTRLTPGPKTTHSSEPDMFTTGAAQTPSIPDKP